jgi:hypothetical protein
MTLLAEDILKANREEAQEDYQEELDVWQATLSDGLSPTPPPPTTRHFP